VTDDWKAEANAHWDRIRARIRANPTIIKSQPLAYERVAELEAKLTDATKRLNAYRAAWRAGDQ
jgi:hypothetical protein